LGLQRNLLRCRGRRQGSRIRVHRDKSRWWKAAGNQMLDDADTSIANAEDFEDCAFPSCFARVLGLRVGFHKAVKNSVHSRKKSTVVTTRKTFRSGEAGSRSSISRTPC